MVAAESLVDLELTVLREECGKDSLNELGSDVSDGLSQSPKQLNSKYLYDDAGSGIYARITEEEEYYLTRTEHAILTRHAGEIVARMCGTWRKEAAKGEAMNLVELGAGDGRKTKILLRALLDAGVPFQYMPIDISRRAMAELFASVEADFAGERLRMHGLVGDYMQSLAHIATTWPARRTVVLFLGSSIGNFTRDAAVAFLTALRASLKPRDMLLAGFDLKKDPEVLRRAYSDSNGVTRDFNLNLLTRLNREADANFDVDTFQHLALYNPVRGAMESYLLSAKDQDVSVAGRAVHFDAGEPILTELSYKYLPRDALAMARKAGFSSVANYYDEGPSARKREPWFMDALLEA